MPNKVLTDEEIEAMEGGGGAEEGLSDDQMEKLASKVQSGEGPVGEFVGGMKAASEGAFSTLPFSDAMMRAGSQRFGGDEVYKKMKQGIAEDAEKYPTGHALGVGAGIAGQVMAQPFNLAQKGGEKLAQMFGTTGKITKPATEMAGRVATSAGLGGTEFATTAESPEKIPERFATGAGYGAAGQLLGEGVSGAWKGVKYLGNSFKEKAANLPKEDIQAYEKNPGRISGAPSHEDTAMSFKEDLKKTGKEVTKASNKSREVLRGSGLKVDPKVFSEKIDALTEGYKTGKGKAVILDNEDAVGFLNYMKGKIDQAGGGKRAKTSTGPGFILNEKAVPGELTGDEIKDIIQLLDRKNVKAYAQANNKSLPAVSKASKNLRREIDSVLKVDEDYASAMKPASKRAEVLNDLEPITSNKRMQGERMVRESRKPMRESTNQAMDALAKIRKRGTRYQDDVLDRDILNKLNNPGGQDVNPSALTKPIRWFMANALNASPKAILDAGIALRNSSAYKFADRLMESARKGTDSLIATHQALLEDPEYRAAWQDGGGEQ